MAERTSGGEPKVRIRVVFGEIGMLGPGKADLLDFIHETGSIAAAGRRMKMSYKRAWTLVETMNAMFREPVVISSRGGEQGGGARLTPTGQAVLAAYRRLEGEARTAGAAEIAALQALTRDIPKQP